MSAVEWDEVKRLAADFQRAQLSSTVQRLSERNCVIIISQLIKEKLLDVIFTTDGKEYVTPQQLLREMQDELYIHGGRMNLVDLAQVLNVDLSHVEARAHELVRSNEAGCSIILGQLLHTSYLHQLASQINETLQQNGTLNVSQLTRQYDLPGDFLQSLVEKELGRTIQGQQDPHDPRVLFTERFVSRCRAALRGALCAVTRPTQISTLISVCSISERLFYSIFDSLREAKQVAGVLTGRQGANSIFIPAIYSKCQINWVNSFYRQNGYLEFDALSRLGISDPSGFVKRHFPSEKLLYLPTCAVGPSLVDQVEASVEEVLATGTWLDLMPLLPSVLSEEDGAQLVEEALKRGKQSSTIPPQVMCGCMVVSGQLLTSLSQSLQPLVQTKAQEAVSSGVIAQAEAESRLQANHTRGGQVEREEEAVGSKADSKREERRKKATGGKGGGGTQGRETKMRSTKKKQRGGRTAEADSDSDDVAPPSSNKSSKLLQIINVKDVRKGLVSHASLADCTDELLDQISAHLCPALQQAALATARQLAESVKASKASSRRQTHADLQERLSTLLQSLRMFERGIKQFQSDADTQQGLTKYLLKTLGTDLAAEIFSYACQENLPQLSAPEPKNITPEVRVKLLAELPVPLRQALTPLHKSLTGTSVDDLFTSVEGALSPGGCDVVVRKPDKKKERQQLLTHRMALLEQLTLCKDPALALHLTALLLFQAATQQALHASGKFVSAILALLKPSLPPETHAILQKYHDLVLKHLTAGSDEELQAQITSELEESLQTLKEIAHAMKKLPTADKNLSNKDHDAE